MPTMESDALQMELIRIVMETENLEVLKKMEKYLVRISKEQVKKELKK